VTSPTLICCAHPFGYGPAAKLLVIARMLRAAGVRTVFIGHGISHELAAGCDSFQEVIHARPGDPHASKRIALSDGLFSVMERDFASIALELSKPLYVADSLHWMRHSVPEPFGQAERYWVQNFGLAHAKPQTGVVVGPIVQPLHSAPERSRHRLVINLGGCEPPFGPISEDWSYCDFVMHGLLQSDLLTSFKGDAIMLVGNRARAHLKTKFPDSRIQVRSVSHDSALALLGTASRVLTSPGLTASLECFQYAVPTYFLPPQNYSQWQILNHFRAADLADGAFGWSQAMDEPPPFEKAAETERTPMVRQIVAELSGAQSARAMFVDSLQRWAATDQKELALRQHEFFKSLGPNGAERIAGDLIGAFGADRAGSLSRRHDAAMIDRNAFPRLPDRDTIERIFRALGSFNYLTYAPPNIYPMSAPAFQEVAGVGRTAHNGGPLGVYIHIPFCNYACSFCFYAKRVGDSFETMARYVSALERELAWIPQATPLTQLYVGGGTPTVLPPDLLDRVLTAVFGKMRRGPIAHTVECSPESVTDEHMRVLRKHGIGRVSMGIQSAHDEVLGSIRRKHAGALALEACARLVREDFMVNVDLIYGLPGQTEMHFGQDLERVAASGVHSVTAYNLRVNERTPIAKSLSDDERLEPLRLMQWRAFVRHAAVELGYRQTRWHTFVRHAGDDPGTRRAASFKDLTGQGDQFGAGLSARSRLDHVVYRNRQDLDGYVNAVENGISPVNQIFPLNETARQIRYIALSLGDGECLDRTDYLRTFGTSFDDDFAEPLKRMTEVGLIADGPAVSLTDTGKLLYDKVLLSFYPEHVKGWLKQRERYAVAKGRLMPVMQV
jgi:oxygen-independent coproporphyrinogen III oxidase